MIMDKSISKFRLRSSAFERSDDIDKISPKTMIVLSVEGDRTEREYFEHLNKHLDNTLIKIEVLRKRRGDGYSDPRQVIDLLNEYMEVREGDIIPETLPQSFIDKYSKDYINLYLKNDSSLTSTQRIAFQKELLMLGIDLEYRKYLKNFSNDDDFFGVVLDRDCGNHSKILMEDCIKYCEENGYKCFVTNPCFEFWLLLHLCDVQNDFSIEEQAEFYNNKKISNKHTVVSNEVSKRVKHNKSINSTTFETFYFPNISMAIERAYGFSNNFPELLDNLGTNIHKLLETLGFGK